MLVVAATCVRLGFWQLDRMRQRRELNEGLQARLAQEPVELRRAPRDSAGWLYRRVAVYGTPDVERSIVLPGRAFRGAPGAHVVTPVVLESGEAVLVDRGWVPAADGATVDPDMLAAPDPLRAVGLIRAFPGEDPVAGRRARPIDASAAEGFRRVWYVEDAAALRRQFPYALGAVMVQLLPDTGETGLPVRLGPPPLDAGPHLGYAIQWFSFATIAVVGWLALVLKSSVAPPGKPPQ